MTTPADFNAHVIAEFRATGGRVAALSAGPPLLLLLTTGAMSQQPRIAPLRYRRDGDRWVVFAGNSGRPGLPAWYHNLVAHPQATITVGTETIAVTAVLLSGPEREQLITRHAESWPWWATTVLAKKDPAQLPVIALVRREV
jgi:deazaflavin-dependent oxidoreductase (nitroreductase family)